MKDPDDWIGFFGMIWGAIMGLLTGTPLLITIGLAYVPVLAMVAIIWSLFGGWFAFWLIDEPKPYQKKHRVDP